MNSVPRETPIALAVIASEGSHLAFGSALSSVRGAQVMALVDPGDEVQAVRAWSRQVGRCRVYREMDEMLRDDAIEGALVLSRPEERLAHSYAVLQAGKACLVAVPLCHESAGTVELVEQAQRAGTLIMPAHLLRYEPAVLRANEMLHAGDLGHVRELRCEWTYSPAWDQRAWPSAMVHHLLETIDLSRWWLGEVAAVSADLDDAVSTDGPRIANLIIQHARGVSIHHVYRSAGAAKHERYILAGSLGVLELTGPASGVLERGGALRAFVRHGAERAVPLEMPAAPHLPGRVHARPPYCNLLRDFVEALRSTREPLTHFGDAVAALRILEAARISSREGVKVQMPAPARSDARRSWV